MPLFWEKGFGATSMDALVGATGVGRGAIYSDFGGKEELFLAALERYRQRIADPAIALLTGTDDGMAAIRAFFDYFIGLHAKRGMPGPGCFIANSMTELAPHRPEVLTAVNAHGDALRAAFLVAVTRAARAFGSPLETDELVEIAAFLATASQGLWSYGRTVSDLGELERFKVALLKMLRSRLLQA